MPSDLKKLPAFGPKSAYVNVVVETPQDSPYKYKCDDDGNLAFDKAMPAGKRFPFDYGFVPSTEADDGDPLDVLLLTDDPTFPGCVVHAKLLGVIEAEQTEDGETTRNDRIVAVPLDIQSGKMAGDAHDELTGKLVKKIEKFFVSYNKRQDKTFKVLRHAGPRRAATLIQEGMTSSRSKKHAAK